MPKMVIVGRNTVISCRPKGKYMPVRLVKDADKA